MRLWLYLFFVFLSLTATVASVHAQPTSCPPGIPDRPALSQHIEQADILSGALTFEEIYAHGKELFNARFNACDGQGRPATTGNGLHREADEPTFSRISAPDSNSCAGCHNQPRDGGAGDFVANVFVLAQTADPVLDTVSDEFSNNRNTLGMFGSGPIEMLGREMTADLQRLRDQALMQAQWANTSVTVSLDTKGINFGSLTALPDGTLDTSGVRGVDADLIVKPFHQAGVVISLREFSVNAMNHHHGMQAEERFDLNPDKAMPDYDEDGVERELTIGDITAVTLYQAAMAVPGRMLPLDLEQQASAARGEQLLADVGCTSCHVPELQLESPYFTDPYALNPAGTLNDTTQTISFDMTAQGQMPRLERDGEGAIVRAYTDLKRHDLCDPIDQPDALRFYCDEQLTQGRPEQDGLPGTEFFVTRKLWDVGNSAPYGHRGNLTTIAEAILMHGGEARASRDAFTQLPFSDQQALVDFLHTLQVLPEGSAPVIYEDGTAAQQTSSVQTSDLALVGATMLVLSGGLAYFRRRS